MAETTTSDLSSADAKTQAKKAIDEGATRVALKLQDDDEKWTLTVTKPDPDATASPG
jgi:hypothetical protein